MRRPLGALAFAVAAALSLGSVPAAAQDWDVGPTRPTRPVRPTRPATTRPVRPAAPRPVRPATATPTVTPAAPGASDDDAARRARTLAHLMETVLGDPAEAEAALPALVRMVRERDGNVDGLVRDLEQRAVGPRRLAGMLALASIERLGGRFDAAEQRLRALLDDPAGRRDPTPRLRLADMLRGLGRHADALPLLREAWERREGGDGARALRRDEQTELLRALRDTALAQDDLEGAREAHRRLVALSPGSAGVRRELADALLARQRHAEAAVELEALARALAGDNRVLPPVLRDLGRAQLRAGQAEAAERTLRRGLGLAGGDAGVRRELYDELTEVFARTQRLDAWVAELSRGGATTYERAMLLGRLLGDQGRADAADAAYQRAIALRPQEVDAHLARIQLLAQSGQVEALLAARRRLVAAAPRNPAYVVDLADELVRAGRRDEALAALNAASARSPGDSEMHERLALAFARLGEPARALRETELVARADPNDPAALEALGERLLEAGDRARALATWARIRQAARDPARGAAAVAEVYARHDMVAEAIAAWRDAITGRPDEVDYHKGLAVALEAARQLGEAEAAWRRVIALARDDRELRREARARIVTLWNAQQRLPAEVSRLEAAFGSDPPDLDAGRDLAECYARLRRPDDAERVLVRLQTLDPRDTDTLVALERARTQRGDIAGAMAVLRTLAESDTRRAREWYQRLAQHAQSLHRDAEAVEFAARALQLNPDDAQGHQRLGELYRARGDLTAAAASFGRALRLDDRRFPLYFALADLHLARGEAAEAVALYRTVIRLAPDDDLVARAGRLATQIALAEGLTADLERDLGTAAAAAPGRAVLRRLLIGLYVGLVRPLVDAARHGDAETATAARAALVRHRARALKPLLDALSEPDPTLQRAGLDLLGALGNPNATAALLALAERTAAPDGGAASSEFRRRAMRAAAMLADPRATPRFIGLLRSDDGVVAALAAWTLGRIDTPAARAALVATLRDANARWELRAAAALGLGRDRAPGTVVLLRQIALCDPQRTAPQGCPGPLAPGLQGAALAALGPHLDAAALPAVHAALARNDVWIRLGALTALGRVTRARDAAAQEAVRWTFHGDGGWSQGTPRVREAAMGALALLTAGDPVAHWAETTRDIAWAEHPLRLLGALSAPTLSRAVRVRTAETHAAALATAAREAARDPSGRGAVLETLERAEGLAPWIATDLSPDEARALATVRATVRAAVAPTLAATVRGGDVTQRQRLARVMAHDPSPEARSTLLGLAEDADPAVAETALAGLTPQGDAVPRVISLAQTGFSWAVRVAAVDALARAEGPAITPALAQCALHDPFAAVRLAAVRALVQRAPRAPEARAALDTVRAADADRSVRDAAVVAREGHAP